MVINVQVTTLRQLRQAHGLTQEEAAAKCGVSAGYWSELEEAKRYGMPKKVKQIADAFGLHYYDVVAIILRTHELAANDDGDWEKGDSSRLWRKSPKKRFAILPSRL